MDVEVLSPLVTEAVPRDVRSPWLAEKSIKVKLYLDFVVRVDDEIIVIPKGYVSDWSSLPRILWWRWPPNYSEARHAAVVHDYLYSHLHWHYTKEFADAVLKALMLYDGAPAFTAKTFHLGVRVGGKGGWHYRELSDSHPHWRKVYEKLSSPTGDSFSSPAPRAG